MKMRFLSLAALIAAFFAPTEVWGYYAKMTIAKSSASTSTGDGTVWVSDSKSSTDKSNTTQLIKDDVVNAEVNFWLFAEPNEASYFIGFADTKTATSANMSVEASTSTANAYKYTCKVATTGSSGENKAKPYYAYAIFGSKYVCSLTQATGGTLAWGSGTSPSPSNGKVYQIPGNSATLQVTATPSSGYEFSNWIVNGSATSDSGTTLTKTVSGATTISASFTPYYEVVGRLTAAPMAGGGIYIARNSAGTTGPSSYVYDKTDSSNPRVSAAGGSWTFYCYAKPKSGYMHVGWQTAAQKGTSALDKTSNNYATSGSYAECTIARTAPTSPGSVTYDYYAVFAKEQSDTVWLPVESTKTISNVATWKILDTTKATGSLSGSTLTLTGKATGSTKVVVYTTGGEWVYYNVQTLLRYYARVNLSANNGAYGKVWVGQNDSKDDAATATSDYSQYETGTAGENHSFYLIATPASGYMHWGWLRPDGQQQRHEGSYDLSTYGAKEKFTHPVSTTLNGISVYNYTALFKKEVAKSQTLLLNGTKSVTVAGKLDNLLTESPISNPSVVTATQSGDQVVITGHAYGTSTVKIYTDTDYITYTIIVKANYSAKATAALANDSSGRGTVFVNDAQSASGSYATTSSKTHTEVATASSTFTFYAYATPNAGYGFLGWSDEPNALAYSGTSPKELTIASSSASAVPEKKVYAHFGALFTVTAASHDANRGSVAVTTSSPAASGLTITETTPHKITATHTATANAGYIFRRWVIVRNGETTYSGANPLSGTYDVNTTLTAEFKQYNDAGKLYTECGKTVSPALEFTNVSGVYVTDPTIATAQMDGMKLVVTGLGRAGINVGTASTQVKVDSGDVITVYTVNVTKPHHEHTFTVGIDEETNCTDEEHKFPTDVELIYSSDVKGIADVYQKGERVIVRGANRGTQVTDIDAWYFSANYNINVTKPYVDVAISRSIDTYLMPVSSADDTAREFTNIVSVTSLDTSRVTARQLGNNVEFTTLGTGSTIVEIDCHKETWRYTVTVSLSPVTEMFKVPLGKSVSSSFDEITSITQNDASKQIVGVTQNGTTVTMTGLKIGSTGFTVVGKLVGRSGYVSKTMNVQVYDDSIGHVDYDEAELTYDGAKRVEVLPGGDLLYVFSDPSRVGQFTIPEGYVARARILAVGGGGAGGTQSKRGNGGGGGGAGGFVEQSNVILKGGTYYVGVGKGGRRADAKLNPVAGNNGSNSVITNQLGVAFANSIGGGGGGASMLGNSDGIYGGSGGGAAWYNSVAGEGGQGVHPQGSYGAMPTVLNNGGGGGGASAEGAGSVGGAGTASDITGESIVYAKGGNGGLADGVGAGADGTDGLGNGGDGGNGDFGGNGGDGTVIVRLSSVKMYQKVPIPTNGDGYFTDRFVFEENKVMTSFNRTKFETDFPGALAYVDGVIATNCTKTTENGSSVLHGVGYYSFVLYLNDGYTWNDGTTYGTTEGQLLHWRIVLSATAVDPTVAVNKSVTWDDENSATITITSHSTPEMNPVAPKVLFVGGLCGAHSLTRDTLLQTLNKVAEKADVDYYLYYDHKQHPSSTYAQSDVANSLKCGATLSAAQQAEIHDFTSGWGNTTGLDSDNHCVWPSFVNLLYTILNPNYAKKYDYVILEFDGNRLVHNLSTASTEKDVLGKALTVAGYLKTLYEKEQVIWIVDSPNSTMNSNDPFISNYYSPSTWYEIAGNVQSKMSDDKYALLLCLLDPKAVLEVSNSRYNNKRSNQLGENNNVRNYAGITQFGYVEKNSSTSQMRNDPNPHTTYYGNVSKMLSDLESDIKVVAYNLSGYDRVKADVGLTVTSITVDLALETGAEDVRDVPDVSWGEVLRWTPTGGPEITAKGAMLGITQNIEFNPGTNEIEYNLTNIVVEAWTRLQIHVHDNGEFKSSVGAVQNPVTGKWEKNPNYGSAEVAFVDEGGNETDVKGDAETVVPLTFKAYTVSGEAENGQIFLNGMTNNPISFAEGYSPTVSYRGNPGYWLSELYVDGHQMAIDETNMVYVLFRKIDADHHVRAVYESVVGSVSVAPVTKTYDRVVAVPTVTLGDNWKVDDPANVKVVYSFSADAADDEWLTAEEWAAKTNPTDAEVGVGTKTVYYRVMLNQPGWGEEGSLDSWGWKVVNSGSSTVKINKAPLTISAVGQTIKKGDPVPQNGGVIITGLVGGDTEATALKGSYIFTSSDYNPSTSPTGIYHLMPGGKTSENYEVTYMEGMLAVGMAPIYVNDVPQASFLKPSATGVEAVTKVYDGQSTGLVAIVTHPTSGITQKWSADDGKTWTDAEPLFTNVGTYKVWYLVTDGDQNYITASNYQYVTILPREVTLTSGSATKPFDGEPLTKNEVTLTGGSLVNGETFTYNTISRITEVGTLENEFKYAFSSDVEGNSNYAVTKVLGTLTVTKAQINVNGVLQPEDPDPLKRLDQEHNGVDPLVSVYNGEGTNLVINVIKPATGARILYTTTPDDPDSWTEDLLFTNVTDVAVWYAIEDPAGNYSAVTNFQFLTITPRPVTVTAGSATKVYDATPLTCNTIGKVENMVAGDTLAAMTATDDSWQKDVGTGANKIASVTAGPNTDLNNYSFTYLPGELTVTKRPVTLRSPTKTSVYQSGQSFSFLASEIESEGLIKGEVFNYSDFAKIEGEVGSTSATFTAQDGSAKLANYDITYDYGTLILGDATMYIGGVEQVPGLDPEDPAVDTGVDPVNVVYDGESHPIVVDVTYPDDTIAEKKIRYSIDNGHTWTTLDQIDFTNVRDKTKVWYYVEAENFTSVTNYSYVTITKRPVTVTAGSKSKTYDGLQLRTSEFTSEGFVDGQGIKSVSMTPASTITQVGTQPNEIASVAGWIWGTDASNYAITYEPGVLTVLPSATHPEAPEIVRTYDGNPTNFVVTVSSAEIPNPVIRYSTDGGKTFTEDPPEFTNRGEYPVTYIVEDPAGNHETVTNSSVVTILAREITVKVNPAQMRDGEPEPEYTAIVTCNDNGEALEDSEAAKISYKIGPTGSLKVGTNTLKASGEEYQGNYHITYLDNILTIYDKKTIPYDVSELEIVYDGNPHGITATVTDPNVPNPEIRYSLYEYGDYTSTLTPVTDVSQDGGTPIWFTITSSDPTYQSVKSVGVLKIVPRPVTVTADDKTKRIGADDPVLTATVSNLAAKDSASVITYDISREPGETLGDYTITPSGAVAQGNYTVTYQTGTLTIGKDVIGIDNKPQDPTQPGGLPEPHGPGTTDDNGTGVPNVKKTYDGNPTNIVVNVTNPPEGSTITYLVGENPPGPGGTPTPTIPTFTDAGTNKVWYVVTAPDYTPITNYAWVVIDPRPVTLTAGSDTKKYDGSALTCSTFESDGFVDGQGLTSVQMTKSSTITNVGTQPNVIDTTSLTAKSGTKLSNYTFDYENGTLTVTSATLAIDEKPQDPTQPGGLPEPHDPGTTDDNGTGVDNIYKVYDGSATGIVVTVTTPDSGSTIYYSSDDGKTVLTESPQFTDAGTNRVWYMVIAPNYSPITNYAWVVIDPKPVTLTAGSDSKKYDGDPLTCSTFEADGFVDGQGLTSVKMTKSSTITNVGTQPNVIDETSLTAKSGTKLSNYAFDCENGTLTVTPAVIEIGDKPQDPTQPGGLPTPDKPGTTGDNGTGVPNVKKTYDGNPTNIVVEVTNPPEGGTVTYLVGENPPGPGDMPTPTIPTFTDAGTNKVWYVVDVPNHIPVTNYAWVVIDPRPVTLTAGSDSKKYDGDPLTCSTFEADGFVDGQGLTSVKMTKSSTITNVGAQPNVIDETSLTEKSGTKLSNYTFDYEDGTLTVTPMFIEIGGIVQDPDDMPVTDYYKTNKTTKTGVYNIYRAYNGKATNIVVNVTSPEEGAVVTYSTSKNGPFTSENPTFTDYVLKQKVYYRVEAPNCATITNYAYVTISKKTITFTAKSKKKVYDGKPLTRRELSQNGSFVTGEGYNTAAWKMTDESTITNVGIVSNEIDKATIILNDNTKAENYTLKYVQGYLQVTQRVVTVTADDLTIYYKDGEPTFTAKEEGVIASEKGKGLITYTFTREPGDTPGTYTITPTGEASQGNYSVVFVPGTLTIEPWLFPVGPQHEKIPIDEEWIKKNGGDDKVTGYPVASNYVFTTGDNGQTNWVSYVLGLDPNRLDSVVYLDIEQNLADITKPTLITRGAKVHEMPLGSLTNVMFRLTHSSSPTGTYEKVTDKIDGRFPQDNVPAECFRVNTRFLFKQD